MHTEDHGKTQQAGTNDRIAAAIATPAGRSIRVGLGVGLLTAALMAGGTKRMMLAGGGLFQLAEGMFNRCALSAAIGAPFDGEEARRRVGADS